jgi:hypothetical protein
MSLIDRLPGLADAELSNLHANAVRLGETGSAAQRASAEKLLPALEAELVGRKAAKRQKLADAGKARAKSKKAAAAQPAA